VVSEGLVVADPEGMLHVVRVPQVQTDSGSTGARVKGSVVEDSGEVGMRRISGLVRDPEAPVGDISRLIALEIAGIIERMDVDDPLEHHRPMRDLNDQVKALRELQRTLTESDLLSRKDVLNLDGPKFAFVFKAMVEFFRRAMRDAGVEDALQQSVMLQFADLVKTNDEHLRRDMNKIEMGR
jgi:hypothetical protein